MYKSNKSQQHSFLDFNQPLGLHMNPENRWVKGDLLWHTDKKTIHTIQI